MHQNTQKEADKRGDCSRQRRFLDPARAEWYAKWRATRFSRSLMSGTYAASAIARLEQ